MIVLLRQTITLLQYGSDLMEDQLDVSDAKRGSMLERFSQQTTYAVQTLTR